MLPDCVYFCGRTDKFWPAICIFETLTDLESTVSCLCYKNLIQVLVLSLGEPEPVKNVQAIPLSSRVMRVSWRDTKVSTSVPIVYHVYRSLRNQRIYCGNTTEKSIKCAQLKPYTKYTFYVRRNEEDINATVSNFTMEDSKWAMNCPLALKCTWWNSNMKTVESWFLKPPRETKIGLRNQVLGLFICHRRIQ